MTSDRTSRAPRDLVATAYGKFTIQQKAKGQALQYGAYPSAKYSGTWYTLNVYTNGKRYDAKSQGYAPHGSVNAKTAAKYSGKILKISGNVTKGKDTVLVYNMVKTNHADSNRAKWLMRDYLAYIECRVGPLFCSIVDRVDFRFTIDPGTRTTRISEQFHRFGNQKISKHVTVKAQLYSVGKYRATDYDEWSTPGFATQWLRTPSSQGGRKVKFKMTFTALTPVGVASGTGSTAYTRACSKTDCRWPS